MADQQILVAGTSAVPLAYTVPNAVEAALLCVNATVDGSGASAGFYATVEIVSDGGVVVARCPCFTTIAAGGSAEISWFRMRQAVATTTTGTAYEQLILATNGLRLYWKQDETTGTVAADSSGGGHPGTYINAPTLGVPPLADASAVTYAAGSSQAISTGYVEQVGIQTQGPPFEPSGDPAFTSRAMAVEVWFQTTQSGATAPVLVGSDDGTSAGRWMLLQLTAAGHLKAAVFSAGGDGNNIVSSGVVNDGVKHYAVFNVYNNDANTGTMDLWIDGVLSATGAAAWVGTGMAVKNRGLFLSAKANNVGTLGLFASQTSDELAIYVQPLSASDIAAHYAAG